MLQKTNMPGSVRGAEWRVSTRLLQRKADDECRTDLFCALDRDLSAVKLYDALADRKTES